MTQALAVAAEWMLHHSLRSEQRRRGLLRRQLYSCVSKTPSRGRGGAQEGGRTQRQEYGHRHAVDMMRIGKIIHRERVDQEKTFQ